LDISSSLVVGMSVSPARTSEIRIYSGGAPHRVLTALAPAFESATGHKLAMTFEIVSRIQERLAAGDRPDLIMLPEELIVETAKIVPLLPQGRAVLARVGIGVIVADGAGHPDLSGEASVRSALRRAKAIALADPRTPTGRYLNGMLQRLGLLEELQGRLIHKGAIHGGGEEVASGAADIGLYLVSEVAHIADVSVVGLLPPALQNYLAYGAAIPASNQSPDAALAFISFLSEPANAAYWRDGGFEPRDA
jgi:molybdate transport system substrate-binding protein